MSEFNLLVQTRDPDVVYQEIECTCPGHVAEHVLRMVIKDFPAATAVSAKINVFVTMPPLLIEKIKVEQVRKDGRHPVTSEPEEATDKEPYGGSGYPTDGVDT